MEVDLFLGAVVYPVAALTVAVAIARAFRHRAPLCGSRAVSALALAIAVVATATLQVGGLARPLTAFDWFPWAVAAAGILGALVEIGPHGSRAATRAAVAGAAIVPFTVIAPPDIHAGVRITAALLAGVCAAACVPVSACASVGIPAGGQLQRPTPSSAAVSTACGATMCVTAALLSLLVLESSFAKLSLILGGFSATAACLTVLGVCQRPPFIGAGAVVVWCVAMSGGALYALGNDSSGIPRPVWWLAAASPLAYAGAVALVGRVRH